MDASNEFDAIIVGSGPGGSTTALFLARQGRKALVIDKAVFPRDKTCGDALSGKSLKVLRELGLTDLVEKNPHGDINGLLFSSPNGSVVEIPFTPNVADKRSGYCMRREIYDALLFGEVKKSGATVWENFTVTALLRDGEKVIGVKGIDNATKQEREAHAKIVVGADGFMSLVAKEVGVWDLDPEHTCAALRMYYKGVKNLKPLIEIHFVEGLIPGYFWIFPVDDGMANVGVGMLQSDMKKLGVNLQQATLKAIHENPLFKERFEGAEMVGGIKGWTLPFGSKWRKIAGNGWLLVGDAAALVDPFSGEGMGNAMTSGQLAAQRIGEALDANDTSEGFLLGYQQKVRDALGNELQTSYNMQKLGRIKPLLNFVLHKASKSAKAREMIAQTLTSEDSKKEYTGPLFYLQLLFA